jgi:hypothetical protein
MLAFFTGLFGAISSFPKIMEYVSQAIAAINEAWFKHKKKEAGDNFDKGVEDAKKKKNTCELERAFDPSKKC